MKTWLSHFFIWYYFKITKACQHFRDLVFGLGHITHITMTTTTVRKLTFEEYLTYDDGTDTRYEFNDGELVAMTPPIGLH